ncbi:MAG: DUF6285 domain-containing protein [Acidimicrobiales bacterium]
MQYRPDATELLNDVAALLEDRVLAAVSGPLQHQVRVAANLVRIVEREVRLAQAATAAERDRLSPFVDTSGALADARAQLADRLLGAGPIEPDELAGIHAAIVATLREDLAISKPGYDDWTGA